MEFFRWGKQSSIFGIPVALALVLTCASNIMAVSQFRNVNKFVPMVVDSVTGVTFYAENWTFLKILRLVQLVVLIGWTAQLLATLALVRRSVKVARAGVYFVLAWYAIDLIFAIATLLAFFDIGSLKMLDKSEAFRMLHHGFSPILPWPQSFWATRILFSVTAATLAIILYDSHLSHANIVEAGGTGWEQLSAAELKASAAS